MRFSALASIAAALTATAVALPADVPRDVQIESLYPVGTVKSGNVKVAGRVFNIDGKVGYFAGESGIQVDYGQNLMLISNREQRLVAWTSQQ